MTEAELILQKALVGSKLDSSQWNQIQAGFRNRAFFSSRVAQVNILAAMRDKVRDHLEFETFDGGILHLFVSEQKGIRSFYKTKSGRSLQ